MFCQFWMNQTLQLVTDLPGTINFSLFSTRKHFPGCWLFLLARRIWIYDLYLSYYTRLGWRRLWLPKPRESTTGSLCGPLAHVLPRWWTNSWRMDKDVEAMIPGGEDWVGVEPAWCSWTRGFYILPFCAFFLCDEEGGFARRFFMENWMVIVNMFVASLHRV